MVSLLSNMTRCLGIHDENTKNKNSVEQYCTNYLSLGIGIAGGRMDVVIPSNTEIPIKKEVIYTCAPTEYQLYVYINIQVYEGESSWTNDNTLLGGLYLPGIPPTPLVVSKIKICFDIHTNGTLKVSAQHMIYPKLIKEITITSKQRQSAKLQMAKHTLKKYAENIKTTLDFGGNSFPGKVKAEEKEKIKKVANETIRWLNKNRSAKEYEYKDKLKEVEDLCKPIVTKMYQLDSAGGPSQLPEVENKPKTAEKTAFKLDDVD